MKDAGYSDHEIFAIRNAASSGSTGMDFDQALKEQQDAQKSWNNAYKNATNGHSAPKAWEKMTSKIDPEAYKQMSALNIKKDFANVGEIMDNFDPKWVRQTSDVTMFKA